MERVVKFRGKVVNHDPMTNPENGWVEGYYLQDLDNGEVKHYIFNCPCRWEVVPESVGQFTGLYDESGHGIYEGDVIERFQPNPHYRNGVYYDGNAIYGVVRYIESGFYIVTKDNDAFKMSSNYDMWVQGVIHDNPNLLTNGND